MASEDYEKTGVVGYNGSVIDDCGKRYWFPASLKRREKAPLYSRRIAFDVDENTGTLSDRVSEWEVVDPEPDYDMSGTVVYTHQNRIYISFDEQERDIQAWCSDFYGDPDVGDTVLFDMWDDRREVKKGEVDTDSES